MAMAARSNRPKIRPPRKGLTGNHSDGLNFEQTWAVIQTSLYEMHTKNASVLSYEQVYRHAYKVVLKKEGEKFYRNLQAFEKQWLSKDVQSQIRQHIAAQLSIESTTNGQKSISNERRSAGEQFLTALKEAFQDHQIVMNMATDVFMYLDRVYCSDSNKPSVYSSAMMLFRDHVLRAGCEHEESKTPTILQLLRMVLLEQIAMDRGGNPIDKTLAKACICMLEGLYESPRETEDECLYLTSFEREYLEASREFYEKEGANLLREADAATYCRHTTKRIDEEVDRCRSTLSELTTPKITKVLEDTLIQGKIKDVIYMSSGVPHMIDNERLEDLELVYQLNLRIDPRKVELTQAIQRRIQEVGNQINEAAHNASLPPGQPASNEREKDHGKQRASADKSANQQTGAALQWVEAVLHLKDKYDKIWKNSLHSDSVIQPAVFKSFTDSINNFPRCSEFVSLFIDENMKKGLKDKSGDEIDRTLEKAIVLIRYITDKDMFERYYKKHLCKRLLMQKSLSIENEHDMIRKMKIELGNSFVQKLENMFKDMQLSEELTANYRDRVANSGQDKRTDLSINVLTSMTWPLETMQSSSAVVEGKSDVRCIFPPSIDRVKRGFENFYGEKHSGRQLTWMPHMGTADIRAVFPAIPEKDGPLGKERKHELNVSTYAMLILMLFNDLDPGASLSFDEIQARTNIGHHDLVRNLQSLAVAPKTRVLVKDPMSKDVKNSDRFFFNDKFTSNFLKIKVGVVAGNNRVEGEKERRETERKNNDSRNFAIEAAIVRIMKQRKELSHQQLVAETLSQLAAQFRPDVTMIKKRIESLIEREYLERIEDSQTPAYRYLA